MLQVKWEGMTVNVETPAIEEKIKRILLKGQMPRGGYGIVKKTWSDEEKKEVVSLFQEGISIPEIAAKTNRSKSSISSFLSREGVSKKAEKVITV